MKTSKKYDTYRAVVSDTWATLRRCDVYRLMTLAGARERKALAAYATEQRPDLAEEIEDCRKECA